MSCGGGCRQGSDPVLLWLWCRPAAVALIGRLAWEPPFAMGVALKSKKERKGGKKKGRQRTWFRVGGPVLGDPLGFYLVSLSLKQRIWGWSLWGPFITMVGVSD